MSRGEGGALPAQSRKECEGPWQPVGAGGYDAESWEVRLDGSPDGGGNR